MEKQEKPSAETLEKWSKDPKKLDYGVFFILTTKTQVFYLQKELNGWAGLSISQIQNQ